MNRKVLRTMIALVVIFLVCLYVIKLFFPEQFVMSIENEVLIKIGSYIDNHLWLYILCSVITNFITYWLYLCAVTQKWYLGWKEVLTVLAIIAITQGLYEIDPTLSSGVSIISMIIMPFLFNAKLEPVAIVFSVHYLSQLLSTEIRGLPLLLTNVNYLTIILMTFECYFWLLLFYLYFNYKKKENKIYENKHPTFW